MNNHISASAIELADEISIGDLLRIADKQEAFMGIIRMVSMSKSQLERKKGKTAEDKNLLLDLIELINEIGKERLDEAFALANSRKDAARLASRKTPSLPVAARAINPNRRKADFVRLQRAGR